LAQLTYKKNKAKFARISEGQVRFPEVQLQLQQYIKTFFDADSFSFLKF